MKLTFFSGGLLPPIGSRRRLPILFLFICSLLSIHPVFANELYWVGGNGNWSDLNHWSLTSGNSGGILSPSIPQAGDQINFDANSGFLPGKGEIIVNLEANCKNIKITSGPILLFSGNPINVYGSANFQTGTVINNNLYFKGEGIEQISFNNGVSGNGKFFFIGTGFYKISGKLNSTGAIYFLQGRLDFGSSEIITNFFDEGGCCGLVPFSATADRSLNLGSAKIILNGRNSQSNSESPTWAYTGKDLQSGTSEIIISTSIKDSYAVRFLARENHQYNHLSFTSPEAGPINSTPYQWYQVEGKCGFQKLSFASDGYIASGITVDTLDLAKSRQYYFYGTQRLGVILNATEVCDPVWSMTGIGGLQAKILITKPITLKNARLSYINIVGNLMMILNGIDGGNNNGASFSGTSRNLYWINGGGNWHDPLHWTTNQDGTPSGGCLPSRYDNVFFSSYSGDISAAKPVNIAKENAECSSITWNGVNGIPAFISGPQYGLEIFGSSTWQKDMIYQISNTKYKGTENLSIIRSNGVYIHGNTELSSGGKWILGDSFLSDGDLVFLSGTFNTGGHDMSIRNFGGTGKAIGRRSLNISNSSIKVNGDWEFINPIDSLLELDANKSIILMLAKDAYFRFNAGHTYAAVNFENKSGTASLLAELYGSHQPCLFDTIRFKSSAAINAAGSTTPLHINNLFFSSGNEYTIGTEMSINVQNLGMNDNVCNGMGAVHSSMPGTQAKLALSNDQSLSKFKVTDIHSTDKQLVVIDGVNGGNNTNVRIEGATGKILFWIGGDGYWSDLQHWTYDSTGKAATVSCLPTVLDHVNFNKYSGKNYLVKLDVPAVCADMIWTEVNNSQPGISGNSLAISGSLTLQEGMSFDVQRLEFVGKGEKFLKTNNVVLGYTQTNRSDRGLFFNEKDGVWILNDSLKVKNIGIMNGTLITNGHNIFAENWVSEGTDGIKKTKLILGNSLVTIDGYWDASSIDSLAAGSSTLYLTGILPKNNGSGNGLYTNQLRSVPGHAYFNVKFTNPAIEARLLCDDPRKGYIFRQISFSGETYLNCSNQFNSLTTGHNVHLISGSTQLIDKWITTSNCQQWDLDNNCMSTGDGCKQTAKAKVICNAQITLNNVRISGIEISGRAGHTAFGSDMGNNSGWTFLPINGRNLYWIGGAGDYSAADHWTTNSDGTASGNLCSPGRYDNVIFNEYSGENLHITVEGLAECHDMTWINAPGNPVFQGLIHCYGSLSMQPSLIHNGGITFLSSGSEIIQTRGAIVASNFDINFSGGGKYLLLDDFSANSHINLIRGELNTNDKIVRALSLNGIESTPEDMGKISLILGDSKIYLSYYNSGWQYTGALNAGTSHIYLIGNANIFKTKDGAKYHYVSFDTNPNTPNNIFGSFIVDTLTFARNNSSYQLESLKTITINKKLLASGNPCGTVYITSSNSNERSNLKLLGADTTYNFIALGHINAIGKKLLILSQSTDLGNNSNIIFSPKTEAGIGLLGLDKTVCHLQFPLQLNAKSFLPDQYTRIEWKDVKKNSIIGNSIDVALHDPGIYSITVTYGEYCEVRDTINLFLDSVGLFAQNIKIKQPGCIDAYGSVELPAGFLYSINGSQFSDTTLYRLPAGKHFVLAKSKNDCISDTVHIVINPQQLMPRASIRYPETVVMATGKLHVNFSGTKGGKYSAIPNGLSVDSLTGTIDLSASEPGKVYTISYSVGDGDCTTKDSTTLRIKFTATTIQYPLLDYCANGSLGINTDGIQGGVYIASPSGLEIDSKSGFVNLTKSLPGQYEVRYNYMDGTRDLSVSTYIKVNPLPAVKINADKTMLIEGASLELSASGGLNYQWIGNEILSPTDQSSITVRPSSTTTYRVIATNKEGCSQAEEITIDVRQPLPAVPNNVVTPNGDGKNDYWVIANIMDYPNNNVKIFDRAGRLIYSKKSYHNDWDGRLNGLILNEDAYIYVLDLGNGTAIIRGTVSIVLDNTTNSNPLKMQR
ncbi:gliding motility-associated C-terminal domain-containing protein [Pedobacter sp. KLB.chiD]|uniref:gliding motility-associated C-terminal domain-containing protein n=1 Tax=Pedobacter sp. KLB.chiD TaxID=3387402 RepID=UPI00399BF0FF